MALRFRFKKSANLLEIHTESFLDETARCLGRGGAVNIGAGG